MSIDQITLRRPDDWHVHLRDEQMLRAVLPFTARQFARGIVMPNLNPPITNRESLIRYRERILAALPVDLSFQPLMTLYLTDGSDPDEIESAFDEGIVTAAKLYPAHVTTNAQHGISNLAAIHRTLERMEKIGMPLLVHGESHDPNVDIFDRERVFIEQTLVSLLARFEGLKVVLEHITTGFAADFVRATPGRRLAATITPHHLLLNRNAMFAGGLRPHAYCLPGAKREEDRRALRKAATSGAFCFFLGTDSAPPLQESKESDPRCAGVFCAPLAMETYAQVFDEENALQQLEAFASINGPVFYGLPINETKIDLRRRRHTSEDTIGVGLSRVQVFRSGDEMEWELVEDASTAQNLDRVSPLSQSLSPASPCLQEKAPPLPCLIAQFPPDLLFPFAS